MEYMNKPVFKILKAVCMTNFAEIAKCQSLKKRFCFVLFHSVVASLGPWHLMPDTSLSLIVWTFTSHFALANPVCLPVSHTCIDRSSSRLLQTIMLAMKALPLQFLVKQCRFCYPTNYPVLGGFPHSLKDKPFQYNQVTLSVRCWVALNHLNIFLRYTLR